MNIVCDNWQEGLAYFLDPRIVAKMRRVGLSIKKMDWRNKSVILTYDDDDRYAAIVEELKAVEMSEADTVASPADGWPTSLITSSFAL
jgi:hypothetical protein